VKCDKGGDDSLTAHITIGVVAPFFAQIVRIIEDSCIYLGSTMRICSAAGYIEPDSSNSQDGTRVVMQWPEPAVVMEEGLDDDRPDPGAPGG
jgi:hypothetical protein